MDFLKTALTDEPMPRIELGTSSLPMKGLIYSDFLFRKKASPVNLDSSTGL